MAEAAVDRAEEPASEFDDGLSDESLDRACPSFTTLKQSVVATETSF